jgi:hypothetical protein
MKVLKVALVIAAGLALTHASAYADAVYSFNLVWGGSTGANIYGTGTVTFDNAIPLVSGYSARTNATDTAYSTKLDGLTIQLSDGVSFNLLTDPSFAEADFSVTGGKLVLNNLSYNYYPSNPNAPRINVGGTTYNFQLTASSIPTVGAITNFAPYTTATPEPSSALLLVPALMIFAGWRVRRVVGELTN